MFATKDTTISDAIVEWMPKYGKIGLMLGILPFIDKDLVEALDPEKYISLQFLQICSVFYGTDWAGKTAHKDWTTSVGSQLNKTGGSAFRAVSWSLPMGLVFEFTTPFLGQASKKRLVKLWRKHGRLKNLPRGQAVLPYKSLRIPLTVAGPFPFFCLTKSFPRVQERRCKLASSQG
jgi:hypothetical protein